MVDSPGRPRGTSSARASSVAEDVINRLDVRLDLRPLGSGSQHGGIDVERPTTNQDIDERLKP